MQAAENAQVLQKCSASPSSAIGAPAAFMARLSDGARIARLGQFLAVLVEITVEAHRDDTQQQPAARSSGDPPLIDADQAVRGQRPQPRERIREVGPEIDVVT